MTNYNELRKIPRSIYLPIWIDKKIQQLATDNGTSYNDIINELLQQLFQKEPEEEKEGK